MTATALLFSAPEVSVKAGIQKFNVRAAKSICAAILFPGLFLASLSDSRACTVFCDSQDGVVLAGRNWDMIADGQPPVMWFVPATNGVYGRVCFGRHADCEDGMNDQGLFVAVAAAPPSGRFTSRHPPLSSPKALDGLLASCASVDEAIEWLKQRPNIIINGSWGTYIYQFPFLFGRSYRNSGVGGHFLIADKSGASMVCEWVKGKLKVVRKIGRYQLTTNFLLSKPEVTGQPCPRFATLTEFLKQSERPALENSTRALELASSGLTRYSQVYDLARGEVQVYFNRDFTNPVKINLAAELRRRPREVQLRELFGNRGEVVLRGVTREVAISGDEVLRKSLETRGGLAAALKIRSYHAKGEADLGFGWMEASPFEYFAMRPNKWRHICTPKSAYGLKLDGFDAGFDGQTGWDAPFGAALQLLTGRRLDRQREQGEFFACYDDPAYYQSVTCLGEAAFDGKTCYALKLVTSSNQEETHYYDTTSFLLVGIVGNVESEVGPTLQMTTLGNYREFGGFQFPMRIGWQTHSSRGVVHYSSIEVNAVRPSTFQLPKKLPTQPAATGKTPLASKR